LIDGVKLRELVAGFSGRRVAVFGDLMLDEYIFGDALRISPEAPVPVVRAGKRLDVPGGSANVASNISTLGGVPIVCGIVGDDDQGKRLSGLLADRGIDHRHLLFSTSRQTTLKTRVIAHNQQVVRIDSENTEPPDSEELALLKETIRKALQDTHAVVISDYAKGMVRAQTVEMLTEQAEKMSIPIIADPKGGNYIIYKKCRIITPNHKEAGQIVGMDIKSEEDLRQAGNQLLKMVGCQSVLITWGERGMALFDGEGPFTHLPTEAREVYDVTGAGDTVVATLALAIAAGGDLLSSAHLANFSAGIVVGKMGTSTVSAKELTRRLSGFNRKESR